MAESHDKHDAERAAVPPENLEPLPPEVQEAIDSYARYYAEHHKLGMSVRDDMRYIASLAIRWAPERAASAGGPVNWVPYTDAEKALQAGIDWDKCPAGTFTAVLGILRAYAQPPETAEVEVIDPYVMDLVRKHGSTMTNSEIVRKFLPKQRIASHEEERKP